MTLSTFAVVVLPALMSLMKSFLTRLASVHAAASHLEILDRPQTLLSSVAVHRLCSRTCKTSSRCVEKEILRPSVSFVRQGDPS